MTTLCACATAYAQTAPASDPRPTTAIELEELSVIGEPDGLNLKRKSQTGSRLELTPLETPASVDVISGETARRRGQNSIVEAVTQNAPGMASISPEKFGTSFAMRGFQGNSSVMQLYDGTRLFPGRGNITFPQDVWSVERIEVLHGPASVLYGEGAIGGVINVVPKKPFSGPIQNEAELWFDSNLKRRAAIDSGGSLSQDVSYRFTALGDMSDGWVDRGNSSIIAFSGALRWDANPDLTFTLSSDYSDRRPQRYSGTPLRDRSIDKSILDKNYNVYNSLLHFRDSWTQFRTEWTPTDALKITNTSYVLTSDREFRNADFFYFDVAGNVGRSDYSHIRQQQRQIGSRTDALLRSDIFGMKNETVVGFDVNRAHFSYDSYFPSDTDIVDPNLFPNPRLLNPGFRSKIDQASVFAEDRLSLTEQLTVVGGLRYDVPKLTRSDPTGAEDTYEKTFHSLGWRAGTVYTPIPDLAFFAQYAVGKDPLNIPLLDYTSTFKDFKLATGREIEAGVKQSLWNDRVQWTLSAFEIVKKDLLGIEPSSYTPRQIGQQSSRGFEASVSLALDHGWKIGANGTILRARYDDFSFIDFSTFLPVNYKGKQPLLVPEITGNLWLGWNFAQGWEVNGSVQYVGETFSDYANTLKQKPYALVNLGLNWRPTPDLSIDVRVKNIFDTVYVSHLRTGTIPGTFKDDVMAFIGQPRTAELIMRYRF